MRRIEVVPRLNWRAIAAGTVVGAVLGVLCFLVEHAREFYALIVGATL